MLHRQPTIEEMRAALEASDLEMTPLEHFERIVHDGLVNRKGQTHEALRRRRRTLIPTPTLLPTDIFDQSNGDH